MAPLSSSCVIGSDLTGSTSCMSSSLYPAVIVFCIDCMFGASQTDYDTDGICFSVSGGANTFVGGTNISGVCFGAWSAFLFCVRPFTFKSSVTARKELSPSWAIFTSP